ANPLVENSRSAAARMRSRVRSGSRGTTRRCCLEGAMAVMGMRVTVWILYRSVGPRLASSGLPHASSGARLARAPRSEPTAASGAAVGGRGRGGGGGRRGGRAGRAERSALGGLRLARLLLGGAAHDLDGRLLDGRRLGSVGVGALGEALLEGVHEVDDLRPL